MFLFCFFVCCGAAPPFSGQRPLRLPLPIAMSAAVPARELLTAEVGTARVGPVSSPERAAPAVAVDDGDETAILASLESAAWSAPLLDYVDAFCAFFDANTGAGGRPELVRLHADFKALVEAQLAARLEAAGLLPAAFVELLDRAGSAAARRVLTQLQAMDSWATFSEMMAQRRAECEAAVLAEADAGAAAAAVATAGADDAEAGLDADTAAGIRASLVEAAAERRLQAYEERALDAALTASAVAAAAAAAEGASASSLASGAASMPAATTSPPRRQLSALASLPPLPSLTQTPPPPPQRRQAAPSRRAPQAGGDASGEAAEIERRALHFAGLRSLLAARKAPVGGSATPLQATVPAPARSAATAAMRSSAAAERRG